MLNLYVFAQAGRALRKCNFRTPDHFGIKTVHLPNAGIRKKLLFRSILAVPVNFSVKPIVLQA
jgi:hypothetical protein